MQNSFSHNPSPSPLHSERGATMLEYSLMAACVGILCIGAISMLGNEMQKIFFKVDHKLAVTNLPTDENPE